MRCARGTRALAAVVLTVALGSAASACARSSGPVQVPDGRLPFSLARASASPPGTAHPVALTVYFVRGPRLVAVRRSAGGQEPVAEAAMRALLAGPTAAERRQGIRTAIPASANLLQVGVFDGVAEVDLSQEFQSPASSSAIVRRVAQVVWTLVGLPGVNAVRFAIDGSPIRVVTDRETVVSRPVSAPDYATLAPANPSP